MSVYVSKIPTNGECLLYLAPGSHCAKPAGHDQQGDPYHRDDMTAEHDRAHCGAETGEEDRVCAGLPEYLAGKDREIERLRADNEMGRINLAHYREQIDAMAGQVARVRELAEKWDGDADGNGEQYPKEARVLLHCSRDLLAALDGLPDAWDCDHHPEMADDRGRCHHPAHRAAEPTDAPSEPAELANDTPHPMPVRGMPTTTRGDD